MWNCGAQTNPVAVFTDGVALSTEALLSLVETSSSDFSRLWLRWCLFFLDFFLWDWWSDLCFFFLALTPSEESDLDEPWSESDQRERKSSVRNSFWQFGPLSKALDEQTMQAHMQATAEIKSIEQKLQCISCSLTGFRKPRPQFSMLILNWPKQKRPIDRWHGRRNPHYAESITIVLSFWHL